jgi:hypothetical protein
MANPVTDVPLTPAFDEFMSQVGLANQQSSRDPSARGVHSTFPMATAKMFRHRQDRHHEFEDTMARMFIQVPGGLYEKFLASLEDPATRELAQYLTGDDVKKGGIGYIDFLLQTATHAFTEKVQIVETLSDNYVAFFFGHEAPRFTYSGTLLNTYEDDWAMRMFRIYRDLGRGTQLAKHGQLLRLRYDSMIVSGAMLNFRWELAAGIETYCPFSFDLLVKNVSIIYGSLSPPTDLHMFDNSFSPEGYHLDSVDGGAATKTYFGAPPSTEGTDVTGTPKTSSIGDGY